MAANWTNAQVLAQLNSGTRWTGSTITYAFPTTASGMYSVGEAATFVAVNAAQKIFFTMAVQAWDDLIAPTMSLTSGTSNIEFGFTSSNIDYAHAYYPTTGSAWFLTGSDVATATIDSYGFTTIMHELGHALGLDHMGDYDGAAAATPSSYQDSRVLSIMSYYGPGGGRTSSEVMGADWTAANGRYYSPQTPMLNDVMAIQSIYGASTTTRTDNTVYGFGSTISGNMAAIFDFNLNPYPILTIYDSAGIDTLNLSGWNSASTISLESGVYSSCNYMTNNIVIAYGCVIENAIGGGGNDVLTGNSSDNRLEGGAGNDTLSGGAGNDTLDGGAGDDTAIFSGNFASYTIRLDAATGAIVLTGATSGSDSVSNVEIFQFSDGNKTASQLTPTADLVAPTLSGRSPADESANVAVGANIVLTFNETVRAGSGNIVLTDLTTGTVRSIAATDTSQVSFSGSSVTINPSTDLAAGDRFEVTLAAGVIKDTAGNDYAGLAAGALNFNTAAAIVLDTIAGTTATSATLAIGATGSSAIDTVADQDWWRISLSAGTSYNFRLNKTATSTLDAYLRLLDASGTTLLLNDDSGGSNDSLISYTATASGTYYLSAQSFNGASSGAYTVSATALADTTAPTLSGRSPADESTNVAVGANIVLTFNETVRAGSGNIVITDLTTGVARSIAATDTSQVSFSGSSVTINPSANLTAGHRFEVTLAAGVVKDTAGNNYAGMSAGALNFTTAAPLDTTAPLLSSRSPADESTNVAVSANIVLTFNETVRAGSGNIVITDLATGAARSIAATDTSQVSFSGGSVTINPSTNLAAGHRFEVTLAAGVVKDTAGNNYAGLSTGALNFSTAAADTTAPLLSSRSPADESSNVAAGANIVLTFNETVRAGSGNIVITDLTTGAARSIAATDTSQVSFSGSGVTINPTTDLTAGHRFEVTLAAGVIKDTAGNNYAGLATGGLNFTTAAAAAAGTDLIAATTATSAILQIGTTGTSTIDTVADQDWWRISLSAGSTYALRLNKTASSTLDAYLRLLDSAGNQLLVNDDSGGSNDSLITYTATKSGTYYLSAQSFNNASSGAYTMLASNLTDTVAPVLNSKSPADESGAIAPGANILLTFNETVRAGSGNIVITDLTSGAVRAIAITDTSQASFIGGYLLIDPSTDLAGGHRFEVTLAAGVVKDTAGNNYAGLSAGALNFTTASSAVAASGATATLTQQEQPDGRVFSFAAKGPSVIADFVSGTDKIEVASQYFGNLAPGALTGEHFLVDSAPATDDAVFLYDSATGVLSFDADGSGAAPQVQLLTLTGRPALFAGDIRIADFT